MPETSRTLLANVLLWVTLSILAAPALSRAADSPAPAAPVQCAGTVVRADGAPLPGAEVAAFAMTFDDTTGMMRVVRLAEAMTTLDGGFTLEVARQGAPRVARAFVVARRPGLALDWDGWDLERAATMKLTLGAPAGLAGQVVDAVGKPVPGATVSVSNASLTAPGSNPALPRAFYGGGDCDWLSAETDADGRFSVDAFPAQAQAEIMAVAPGYAPSPTVTMGAGGKAETRIVLSREAAIEGRVVRPGSPAAEGGAAEVVGVPGIHLRCRPLSPGLESIATGLTVSGADGAYRFGSLAPGRYALTVVRDGDSPWLAAPVMVETKGGETTSGVQITLSKGGILELFAKDKYTGAGVESVGIIVQREGDDQQETAITGTQGLHPLPVAPGSYRVVFAMKPDFDIVDGDWARPHTVAEGQTVRVELILKGRPRVKGRVLDEGGRPASDAVVKVVPGGPEEWQPLVDGRFLITWTPSGVSPRGTALPGWLVARAASRNLAAAVKITEDMQDTDVRLAPAATLKGRVVDAAGQALEHADVSVYIDTGRPSELLTADPGVTDAAGNFAITGIPVGLSYKVRATAKGFGSGEAAALPIGADTITLEPITLQPANLTLAGVVVDKDEHSIAAAIVTLEGKLQPPGNVTATTDTDGRFAFAGLCLEKVRLRAVTDDERYSGQAEAEVGDQHVKIIIQRSAPAGGQFRRGPAALSGKPLPALSALKLEYEPATAKGKAILICFWAADQEASVAAVKTLAGRTAALAQKGVVVLSVETATADAAAIQKKAVELGVTFPVGGPLADADAIKFAWGVRDLPWLILTDADHVVRTEGFSLDELDAKLGEAD